MNVFLFIGAAGSLNTVTAQLVPPPTCTGEFQVGAVRTTEVRNGQLVTIYTFTVTRQGAQNALSHFGFPVTTCPNSPYTLAQALTGFTAETSIDGFSYTNITTRSGYGEDGSTNGVCTNGPVFKFDVSMGNETVRYYRLILVGDIILNIGSGYVKYGNGCCSLPVSTSPDCASGGPIPCDLTAPPSVCAGGTAIFSVVPGYSTYLWTVTNGTITSGQGTNQLTVIANNSGTLSVTLNVTKPGGFSGTC
ncbi:MAG: hypothetical protein ABIP80_06920, partial [Ferruginibacter sp.]